MATPAFVQIATGSTTSSPISFTSTWSAPTTAGNLLIAVFSSRTPGAGITASAVVPPAGLGWTQIVSQSVNYGTGGGRGLLEMWYIANAPSQSGAQTWACSNGVYMGSSNAACAMLEYSGLDTSSVLDVFSSAVSPNDNASFPWTTDTTADSGTTTTTSQANELVIAALQTITYAMSDPSGSYTERLDGGALTGLQYLSVSDKTLTSTGTQSTSATYSTAVVSLGVIATFKYTASGGGGGGSQSATSTFWPFLSSRPR